MAYNKNTAGQFCYFQGVDSTTGGIKSGVTWTVRRCIDGTFAAGGGTVTEDGVTGWYKYAMSQADTNGTDLGFNFTGTGAVPQTVNCTTDGGTPNVNAANIGGTAQTGLDLGANWTAARAAHLDADISSRMATYTHPTGFLAATFPGAVGDATAANQTTINNNVLTRSIPGDAMALTAGERTTLTAAIWAFVVTGTTTAVQAMRGFIAAMLGKASGLDTNAPKYRDIADTKNVISATTDASGNRTAVTLDLT